MSLYAETAPRFIAMLTNLEQWLDEASEYAEERGFDTSVLLDQTLFPDQFNLRRQLQSACDTAKFGVSRVAGIQAPTHEDGQQSLPELRARIAEVKAFIADVSPEDFEGPESRQISPSMLRGGTVSIADYTRQFALPNFYFHVTTAYSILRHNGVKLGKRTYLGQLNINKPS